MSNYAYLSDGAKLSATDGAGDGLVYRGSLVYRKQGGTYTLESAGFGGGRIVAQTTSSGKTYTPNYYVTDHLGSVRVVVDSRGEVKERNNYYPYGLRWDDATSELSANRYRYNGKEEQGFLNVPYTDYGARMRDPRYRPDWFGVDPLAEADYSTSPSAFCRNNPVWFIDMDGMEARRADPDSLQNVQLEPVVVEARRKYDLWERAVLSVVWSAAGWGRMWNNAVGNRDASFNQNMLTGFSLWQSFALSWGMSQLTKPNTTPGANKQIKISEARLEHIKFRHWITSNAKSSKFLKGTTVKQLKNMIHTSIEKGAVQPNTLKREGQIFIHDFGTTIGTKPSGVPTSKLKVVVNNNNEVITAYPY